jgi:type IV secretory pathway VirJ component
MRLRFLVRVAALLAALSCPGAPRAQTIEAASFGTARVAVPSGAIRGYVALFSDAGGWTADDDMAINDIARAGALTVGVDTKLYLANLQANRNATRKGDCVDFFQDVEDLSRQVQQLHPSAFYNLPIIAGIGEGGAVAYAALAQAPADVVSDAISLDPAAELDLDRPLCRLPAFPVVGPQARALGPAATLHGDWQAAFGDLAPPDGRARIEGIAREGAPIAVTSAPGADRAANLVGLVERRLVASATAGVESLPLVPLPASRPSPVIAIFLSGDGGWRDLDKTVGEQLQAMGVPVVGWDSLRYFWRRKSAERTAADLTATMAAYGRKWGAARFALIGYSFGADVLPVVYNLLPPRYRDEVAMISLLGLEPKADWEIRIAGWFGAPPSASATPLAPEFAKISPSLIQCIYGVEEKDPACLALAGSGAELIETPGEHHFGHDYVALANDLIKGLRRRGAL